MLWLNYNGKIARSCHCLQRQHHLDLSSSRSLSLLVLPLPKITVGINSPHFKTLPFHQLLVYSTQYRYAMVTD
jgi:hypothetical protein